jgi:cell division protein FtsL
MSLLEAPARDFPTRGGAALAPAPDRQVAPHPVPKTDARHLRVVAPSERVRRRLTPAMGVVMTGLLFAMLFAIAIAHTLLVQGQIRLDGIDEKLTVEQARYQQLRNEVAGMESPARVVAAAQALGMVAPDDLVYLQPDAAVHSPNGGAGATGSTSAPAGTDWSAMKPLLEAPAQ